VLASDADRDRVVQALKEAYVQGRLTHDELDQRLRAALASRTTEETRSLLDDLPHQPAPPAMTPPVPPATPSPLRPYFNWWPAFLVGVAVLALAGDYHRGQYVWWMVFTAFFWFRGGHRWLRHRRPPL
jgi:hypothetical protein